MRHREDEVMMGLELEHGQREHGKEGRSLRMADI